MSRGCHEVVTGLSRGRLMAFIDQRYRLPSSWLAPRACYEVLPHGTGFARAMSRTSAPLPHPLVLVPPPPPIPRPLLPVTLLTPQAARQGPPRTSRGHTHTHSDARTHSHTPPRFDDYSQGWYAHGWRFAAVSPAFRERGERGRGGGGKSYPVKFSVENLTRGGHGRGREGVLDWVSSSPSRT